MTTGNPYIDALNAICLTVVIIIWIVYRNK